MIQTEEEKTVASLNAYMGNISLRNPRQPGAGASSSPVFTSLTTGDLWIFRLQNKGGITVWTK